MVEFYVNGGAFMHPILGAFIIGLVFVLERLVHLLGGLATGEKFANEISDIIRDQGFSEAKAKCETSRGPVANICLAAVDRAGEGADEASLALDSIGAVEMSSLEKNMTWISLMIAVAPMLGFLGTVVGMIKAFNDIMVAQDMTPATVAGGISQALLTTAFGLIVAVILQLLQNACLYIIDNQIVTMQKASSSVLVSIKERLK